MKKLSIVCFSLMLSAVMLFCGCVSFTGADGKDGKDGENASVYDYYEFAKSQNPDLTVDEFLKEYLNYSSDEIEKGFSLQAAINRSLFSGVSIASVFTLRGSGWGTTQRQSTSFGAGTIIELDKERGDALVVTNCHVIYNNAATRHISDEVYLFLYGQDENYDVEKFGIEATVVAASLSYDLALLKVEGSEVLKNSSATAAKFCDSNDVSVGETVYAIGNPQGYGMAATEGIISKDSEYISVDMSSTTEEIIKNFRVMRTDAAINGGNSGGRRTLQFKRRAYRRG